MVYIVLGNLSLYGGAVLVILTKGVLPCSYINNDTLLDFQHKRAGH